MKIKICRKCGYKIERREERSENPSRDLRNLLREDHALAGAKIKLVGCMDLCPKGQIAMKVFCPKRDPECITVNPDEALAEVLKILLKK